MRVINLNKLEDGLPGISPTVGMFLAEAAAYSFHAQGHKSGVILNVVGDFEEKFIITWSNVVNEQIIATWKDHVEAVEYAATAIAVLLLLEFTDYVIKERSFQKGIGDYILSKKGEQKKSEIYNAPSGYLEVSGIWKETKGNTINIRLRGKKQKLKKEIGKIAFVLIAEFNIPKAKMIQL